MTLTATQLDLLASPACADAFMAVIGMGKATAKEVAAKVNRTPATALYHLARLEKAGLIFEVEKRPAVKKPEGVYQATSTEYELPKDPETRGHRTRAVVAGLRQVIRGWEKSSEHDLPHRHILRASIRLKEADAQELVRRLEAISEFVKEKQGEEGELLSWASVLYPVV